MAVTGTRKAAVLLMSLEPATAAELLKSAEPEVITRIAAELAYLDSAGRESIDYTPAREFTGLLRGSAKSPDRGDFIRQMLDGAVGPQKSLEMLQRVEHMVQLRDPFRSVRSADVAQIGEALRGESASVHAMVLTELSPDNSAKLLTMLAEDIRQGAVRCMAGGQQAPAEAKLRVASAVSERLKKMNESEDGVVIESAKPADEHLRKLAVLLRGLDTELRSELSGSIASQNKDTADEINKLMVIWDDVAIVADRCLQEALRSVDAQRLALALVDASPKLTERIKENISERARNMLDEEASLLSSPKEEEISQARETVLGALREMNSQGELSFDEQ